MKACDLFNAAKLIFTFRHLVVTGRQVFEDNQRNLFHTSFSARSEIPIVEVPKNKAFETIPVA